MGQDEHVWTYMVKFLNVRSVIDVVCGRGWSTKWFVDHNVDALCVEGSHDAVSQSLLPPEKIVEHDFARGPWWPSKTYDVVWSIEFVEHVSRQFIAHYLPIFRRAAIIMITHSVWGGWHHVEVHEQYWWIVRMELAGFLYSDELTEKMKAQVTSGAEHLIHRLLVFLNPVVGKLPEHDHLMGGPGCGEAIKDRGDAYACVGPDKLPERYFPVYRKSLPQDTPQWDGVNEPPPRSLPPKEELEQRGERLE
jgi:hypothetical protein